MDAMERDDGGVDRRRLVRGMIAVAAVAQLLIALPFLMSNSSEHTAQIRLVAPARAAEEEPTTTEAPLVLIEEPTTTTMVALDESTTTTALVCRNSTDPRCGPMRWDPAPPPNQKGTMEITFEPESPEAGQEVLVRFHWRDPDATDLSTGADGPCYGDRTGCLGYSRIERCDDRYGPWDPPVPTPGDRQFEDRHVYAEPGTYTVFFEVDTANSKCAELNIYGEQVGATREIVVRPSDSPATTTSTTAAP